MMMAFQKWEFSRSHLKTMYLFLFYVRKCVAYIYARAPSAQYPPRPEEHTRPPGTEVKGRGEPCAGNLCSWLLSISPASVSLLQRIFSSGYDSIWKIPLSHYKRQNYLWNSLVLFVLCVKAPITRGWHLLSSQLQPDFWGRAFTGVEFHWFG